MESIDLTQSSDEESPPAPHPQTQHHVNLPTPTHNDTVEGLKPSTTCGKGLWDLWTRNFKSPLMALLDLIDNSVDAALLQEGRKSDMKGRVQIYRDVYKHDQQTYTTGLCIRNNSMDKIRPLDEALSHLYSSEKGHSANSIGEKLVSITRSRLNFKPNKAFPQSYLLTFFSFVILCIAYSFSGVGLKQAAASLGDLTFVLVKNGSNKDLELGIIAKALQSEVGYFLPCFKFNETKNLYKKMMAQFNQSQYVSVAKCIAEYGKTTTDGVPSLDIGIERLCKHFDGICNKFHGNSYVFEVILDKIHDRNSNKASGGKDKQVTVAEIILKLQHEIPMRYLHIDETFKFSVGKKELAFRYWQDRLVEFTQVEIPVRSKTPWHQNFGADTADQYWLRIFLGFDRFRISESDVEPETGIKKANKQCSLYIYSRTSGRLILHERDCRVRLRLNAGGTEYCQALTVIIDDVDGKIPVNPTKQDVVFSNQSQGGETHESNLYATVRAVVAFYYTHHKKKCNGKKNILTSKISQFVDRDVPDEMKSCANCELTTYAVSFDKTKTNLIRVDHSEEEPGVDTIFRLLPEDKTLKPPEKAARKRKPSPTKKKQQSSNPEEEPQASNKKRSKKDVQRHSVTGTRSSPRAAGKPKYCEEDDGNCQSDSDDASSKEREDNGNKLLKIDDEGCVDLCMSSDDESRKPTSPRAPKPISPERKDTNAQEALLNKIDELEIDNSTLTAKTERLEEELKAKSERHKTEIETLEDELKAAKRKIRMLERER